MAEFLTHMLGNQARRGLRRSFGYGSESSEAEANPLVSCCVGFVFIGVSIGLLAWAEKRYVNQVGELDIIKDDVFEITTFDTIDTAAAGKLIHLSGGSAASNLAKIEDPKTHLSPDSSAYIVFDRNVEQVMNTENGRSIKPSWIRTYQGGFPSVGLVGSGNIKIGAYTLSKGLLDKFKAQTKLQVYPWKPDERNAARVSLVDLKQVDWEDTGNGYICWKRLDPRHLVIDPCDTPSNYSVGTRRFNYETITSPKTVSIMASVGSNGAFRKWHGEFNMFERIRPGSVTAKEFIADAKAEAKGFLWAMRISTLIMMVLGFRAVFGIIDWLTDWIDYIPIVGDCIEDSISCLLSVVALIFGITLWVIVWAICWIAVRPMFALIAVPLVVLICCGCCVAKRRKNNDEGGGGHGKRRRGRRKKRDRHSDSSRRSRSSDSSSYERSRHKRRRRRRSDDRDSSKSSSSSSSSSSDDRRRRKKRRRSRSSSRSS